MAKKEDEMFRQSFLFTRDCLKKSQSLNKKERPFEGDSEIGPIPSPHGNRLIFHINPLGRNGELAF